MKNAKKKRNFLIEIEERPMKKRKVLKEENGGSMGDILNYNEKVKHGQNELKSDESKEYKKTKNYKKDIFCDNTNKLNKNIRYNEEDKVSIASLNVHEPDKVNYNSKEFYFSHVDRNLFGEKQRNKHLEWGDSAGKNKVRFNNSEKDYTTKQEKIDNMKTHNNKNIKNELSLTQSFVTAEKFNDSKIGEKYNIERAYKNVKNIEGKLKIINSHYLEKCINKKNKTDKDSKTIEGKLLKHTIQFQINGKNSLSEHEWQTNKIEKIEHPEKQKKHKVHMISRSQENYLELKDSSATEENLNTKTCNKDYLKKEKKLTKNMKNKKEENLYYNCLVENLRTEEIKFAGKRNVSQMDKAKSIEVKTKIIVQENEKKSVELVTNRNKDYLSANNSFLEAHNQSKKLDDLYNIVKILKTSNIVNYENKNVIQIKEEKPQINKSKRHREKTGNEILSEETYENKKYTDEKEKSKKEKKSKIIKIYENDNDKKINQFINQDGIENLEKIIKSNSSKLTRLKENVIKIKKLIHHDRKEYSGEWSDSTASDNQTKIPFNNKVKIENNNQDKEDNSIKNKSQKSKKANDEKDLNKEVVIYPEIKNTKHKKSSKKVNDFNKDEYYKEDNYHIDKMNKQKNLNKQELSKISETSEIIIFKNNKTENLNGSLDNKESLLKIKKGKLINKKIVVEEVDRTKTIISNNDKNENENRNIVNEKKSQMKKTRREITKGNKSSYEELNDTRKCKHYKNDKEYKNNTYFMEEKENNKIKFWSAKKNLNDQSGEVVAERTFKATEAKGNKIKEEILRKCNFSQKKSKILNKKTASEKKENEYKTTVKTTTNRKFDRNFSNQNAEEPKSSLQESALKKSNGRKSAVLEASDQKPADQKTDDQKSTDKNTINPKSANNQSAKGTEDRSGEKSKSEDEKEDESEEENKADAEESKTESSSSEPPPVVTTHLFATENENFPIIATNLIQIAREKKTRSVEPPPKEEEVKTHDTDTRTVYVKDKTDGKKDGCKPFPYGTGCGCKSAKITIFKPANPMNGLYGPFTGFTRVPMLSYSSSSLSCEPVCWPPPLPIMPVPPPPPPPPPCPTKPETKMPSQCFLRRKLHKKSEFSLINKLAPAIKSSSELFRC